MTQLHIVGTGHKLQCGVSPNSAPEVEAFEKELQHLCNKYSIQRIAEEMSADGLASHGVFATIASRVAKQLKLEHQYVDLDRSERKFLSIDDQPVLTTIMCCSPIDGGAQFRRTMNMLADEVRERVWVSRLLTMRSWPCLFVCGADHVSAVRRLWSSVGLESKVAHFDYAP